MFPEKLFPVEKILFKSLDYQFKDRQLIVEALSHPSLRSHDNKSKTYERLEFVGDSILSMIVAEFLFKKFPNDNEGRLSKRLVGIVCAENIFEVAKKLDIAQSIIMTIAEEKNDGRKNMNAIADVVESLIAAIYLDSGLQDVKDFITLFFLSDVSDNMELYNNPKSYLQEITQERFFALPIYRDIRESGPEHKKSFEVSVEIDRKIFYASGKTKKKAEIEVAKKAIEFLKK